MYGHIMHHDLPKKEIEMPNTFQLKPSARDFFTHVYQAGLASPFSDERVKIEQMIAGSPTSSPQKRIERAIREVRQQLEPPDG